MTTTIAQRRYSLLMFRDIMQKKMLHQKSIKIGNKTIEICRQYQVNDAMFDVRVGDEITFVVERNGVEMLLTKTVDASMVAQY